MESTPRRTHRLCTLDELGQPITAWKLRGEMGHGTEKMIAQRYGRYAQHRARRPVLEYRWSEWADRHGDRLTQALAGLLTEGQRRTLEALTSSDSCIASVSGEAPWLLTADGAGVLGIDPPQAFLDPAA